MSKKKQKITVNNFEEKTVFGKIKGGKEIKRKKSADQKDNPILSRPKTKVNTYKTDKSDLERNEPKLREIDSQQNETKKIIKTFEKSKVNPKDNPKPKDLLPRVHYRTTKPKDEIIIVNYEFSEIERTNSYPVFRYPKKGNVIRSYRLGKTKRRGFKEESFQKSIESCFGMDFEVLGNVRLNTGKETRPFEPDIVIIDNSNVTNLRINIEIDEPYSGITRQPTHCKGEDVFRDLFFTDRGWVVVRFSEYQVHLYENECLNFIAKIIKSANPKYDLPNRLLHETTLKDQTLWEIFQAQRWEKEKYREKYLNHTFQVIEDKAETNERDFDEQEIREEKLITPTLIGKIDKKQIISFNRENTNLRDLRIKFYPEPHYYTIDNIPASSTSTIIGKFFPEFDSHGIARKLSPRNPLFGLPIEEIVEIWNTRGVESANKGSYLHEQIEKFYLGQEYYKTEEFYLFEQFYNQHKNIKPYRTEWKVFDEEFHIVGTIDLIAKNGSNYELYDWKRSSKLIKELNGNPNDFSKYWGNYGVGKLSKIRDTSQNRYFLQQNMYKYIIEKHYGLTISKMYLIALHPDYNQFYKIEVPNLKDEIEFILNSL